MEHVLKKSPHTFIDLNHIVREHVYGIPPFARKATTEQFAVLSHVVSHLTDQLELYAAYEITDVVSHPGGGGFANRAEPTTLLCHATRKMSNIPLILNQGLQVGTTIGRLGKAIYMADAVQTSSFYSFNAMLGDGRRYAVVFMVEAALGRVLETTVERRELKAPPPGIESMCGVFDSNLPSARAVAQVKADDESKRRVSFADGTQGVFPSMRDHPRRKRREYAVYTPNRVRLRFMLMFVEVPQRNAPANPPTTTTTTTTAHLPSNNSLPTHTWLEAMQRQKAFQETLRESIHGASMKFGPVSPQVARLRQTLAQASDDEAVDVFLASLSS